VSLSLATVAICRRVGIGGRLTCASYANLEVARGKGIEAHYYQATGPRGATASRRGAGMRDGLSDIGGSGRRMSRRCLRGATAGSKAGV